jgi:DNA repair protein SbcC/Rad50
MLISRLHLVNFRQHEDTELVLGAGLTGIIGPNGAGKTTLLEAIAWALYGSQAARGSKETLRRRGAPPRAKVEVEVEFSLGAHQYRVVRGLAAAELYQDAEAAPIANSLVAVTDRITRLLGMTRDEFFNTYFTGQKELAVMAAMSPADRAQFLSRVLGYERIRTAQDRLRDRRSSLRARLDALRAGQPDAAVLAADEAAARDRLAAAAAATRQGDAAFAAADRALLDVRPRWEALQRSRDAARALDAERRVAEAQLRGASEKAESLGRQAAESSEALGGLAAARKQLEPVAQLREESARLDGLAEAYNAQRGVVAQLEEVRGRLAALEARAAALPPADAAAGARDEASSLRAELTVSVLHVEERRTAWVRDRQDADTQLRTLRDQYQELKDQRERIVAAGHDGACPTCARPLHDEFEQVLGLLDRQLEGITNNGQYFRQRLEQLEQEPADLVALEDERTRLDQRLSEAVAEQARLETLGAERRAVEAERARLTQRVAELERAAGASATAYDPARHAEVRAALKALEPVALRVSRLEGLAQRAEALAVEATASAAEQSACRAQLAELVERLSALGYTEAAFTAAQREHGEAERTRRDAELALVGARAEEASAGEALAAAERRRREAAERAREATRVATDLALQQELDRALADLRTDLNSALRPELSELASAFVRDLTNGRYTELELDESYMATLLEEGDPKSVISGGEEDIANLALRLAISQMIADRAGQPLSLLILDEIFGSLDEERRAAVVELLRSLRDRFPQVILITHIDTVRDGFDRVIRVDYDAAHGTAVVRDEPLEGDDVAA